MTTKEVWKDIPNYEGYYQASNLGRVKSLDRTIFDKNGHKRFYKSRIIKGSINKDGYKKTKLVKDRVKKTLTIPQIIAITFLGHTPNGNTLVVDHLNGNKIDDRVENLRIVTTRENATKCYRSDRENLSSKHHGVSWNSRNSRWIAQIRANGVYVYLGLFINELDASDAYQSALSKIEDGSFNPNDYKPRFSSDYKGVFFHKGKRRWMSRISINGYRKHLGSFHTELEAHHAYQLALNKQM